MASTTKTWYLVRKGGRQMCIEVEHYVSNKCAAQRDMMKLFGLSSGDIITSSAGTRNPWPTMPCSSFNGTNSH